MWLIDSERPLYQGQGKCEGFGAYTRVENGTEQTEVMSAIQSLSEDTPRRLALLLRYHRHTAAPTTVAAHQ